MLCNLRRAGAILYMLHLTKPSILSSHDAIERWPPARNSIRYLSNMAQLIHLLTAKIEAR